MRLTQIVVRRTTYGVTTNSCIHGWNLTSKYHCRLPWLSMKDAYILLRWGLVSLSAQNLVYVCSHATVGSANTPIQALIDLGEGYFARTKPLVCHLHFEASHSWDCVWYQFPLLDSEGNHFSLLWFDGWLIWCMFRSERILLADHLKLYVSVQRRIMSSPPADGSLFQCPLKYTVIFKLMRLPKESTWKCHSQWPVIQRARTSCILAAV